MSVSLVLTVIGPDRPGLVEALSQAVVDHHGNWLESRMARLAGQFAGVLRVEIAEEHTAELARALEELGSHSLQVIVARSEPIEPGGSEPTQRVLHLDLVGSDRPGIIREISQALAGRGINVDELRTGVESAPMSGELLFRAHADLHVPASLDTEDLRSALEELATDLMVDVELEEAG